MKNGSNAEFNLWSYDCKAIQNGKQNDMNDDSCFDYPKISDNLSSGTESSGIVVFPKLDDGVPMTLIFKCGTDDFNLDLDNFTFEINPK